MKFYKRINPDGSTRTVESYSHTLEVAGAIEIKKVEYNAFIKSLPIATPKPVRDLAAEIDVLKSKVIALEQR